MSGLRFKRGYGEMMIGSSNFNMFEDLQKREIIVSKSYFSKNRKVLPDISHITDNSSKTNETDFEL